MSKNESNKSSELHNQSNSPIKIKLANAMLEEVKFCSGPDCQKEINFDEGPHTLCRFCKQRIETEELDELNYYHLIINQYSKENPYGTRLEEIYCCPECYNKIIHQ